MLEGLSLATIMPIVSMLGLPGLILIFWHTGNLRNERDRKEQIERDAKHEAQQIAANTIQEKRFESVVRMYEDNVLLVKGYERLAGELTNVILLNTQVNTKLAASIENNHYCPLARERRGA